MMVPQALLSMLMFLGTGVHLAKHGEPRTGHYSFVVALLSDILTITLLWWGGFFDVLLK